MGLIQSRVKEGAQKGVNVVYFIKTYVLGHLNQFSCENLTPTATFGRKPFDQLSPIGEISGRLKCTTRKAYF